MRLERDANERYEDFERPAGFYRLYWLNADDVDSAIDMLLAEPDLSHFEVEQVLELDVTRLGRDLGEKYELGIGIWQIGGRVFYENEDVQ